MSDIIPQEGKPVAHYDEKVIQLYAEQLYQQADALIASTAAKYTLVALLAGWIGASVLQWQARGLDVPVLIVGILTGAVGLAAGISEGKRRAFAIKLEAQQVLMQLQIERNTRKAPAEL